MNTTDISRGTFIKSAGAMALVGAFGTTFSGCSKNPAAETSVNIAIIGGGAAGISMAARLRRELNKANITIIDPAEKHFFQPGFTFIGAGVWQADDVWKSQKDLIPSGVRWVKEAVTEVDAAKNSIRLASGNTLSYDYLVLVPGIQCNWDKIEGFSYNDLGKADAYSIYDFEGSQKTWQGVQKFVRTGGRGIYADTWTKHKCGGAPKKICLLTERLATKEGTRSRLKFDYYTHSKKLYDVPHYTPRLEAIYKERDIPIKLNTKLTGIDLSAKKAYFSTKNPETNEETKSIEEYDFLHFAPPQSAPDFVRTSGLGWTEGKLAREAWVMVDKKTFVHKTYSNIISLGDVAGIPTSKTSAAIRKQAPIAVANLCDLIAGKAPSKEYDGYAACPIITDFGKVIMAEFDYEKKPQNTFPLNLMDMSKESSIAWYIKAYMLKPLYFHGMLRGLC